MSPEDFRIAFWHPFGPHAGEDRQKIIERKQEEIRRNGWTLWSFQYRRAEMLRLWCDEISKNRPDAIFVFCSTNSGSFDPGGVATKCVSYEFVGSGSKGRQLIPQTIEVPHPFQLGKNEASAFIVQELFCDEFPTRAVEWLGKDGTWRQNRVPTRGEYLIRPGGTTGMRDAGLALKLKSPYLARVFAS